MSVEGEQMRYGTEVPPLWVSPFDPPREHAAEDGAEDEEKENIDDMELEYDFDGFHTYADRKPWSDLLLDISMATTFNSLTNGTKVLDEETCVSYLCFFILVWWIWASRVAYDVRFTKGDWVHRIYVLLQFIVFCALAAFTKDFDIGYKIAEDEQQQVATEVQHLQNYSSAEIKAAQYRLDYLPLLNAKGTSIVLMLSRLLLLFQYVLVCYQAPKMPSSASPLTRLWTCLTGRSFRSFQTHVTSLLISSVFYLIAFIVLDSHVGADTGAQVAKIILWYFPVLMEIGTHYLAQTQRGHVPYPSRGVFERCAAAFVIILGTGLDKITEGFQLLSGNASIGGTVAGLILASATVFIAEFSMYFEMTTGHRISRRNGRYYRRVLTWFFFHFVYFASLIIMLQAIAAILQFESMGKALELPQKFVKEANHLLIATGGDRNLTSNDFDIGQEVKLLGLDIGDFAQGVNDGIAIGHETNSSELNPEDDESLFNTTVLQVAHHTVLKASVVMITVILDNFDAAPDTSTALGSVIELYLNTTVNRTDFQYNENYAAVLELAYTSDAKPELWFFGSAGTTLIALALLSFIRWWKEMSGYRRFVICFRFGIGVVTCLLSLLDINYKQGFLTEDPSNLTFQTKGSPILVLVSHSLTIPIFAIILVCDQIVEFIFIIAVRRKTGHGTRGKQESMASGHSSFESSDP